MKEQGYDLPEITTQIEDMTLRADWTQPGLSPKDLHTITDVFNRPAKYEFRPKEDGPAQAGANGAFVSASSLLDEAFEYLADKDKVKGEPSGIEGLDRLLGGGFRSGELTVLMANAKSGKNTLYHYLLYSFLKRGIPFGYASRELSPATEVLPNLLTIDTGTNMWKCEKFSEDFKRVARSAVTEWPLYFAPGYGYFPVNELEQWFRAMKEQGVSHFLFDHFHYALLGEDYEATAQLIKKLKSLTKELDIHLNLIVQPRSLRDGEKLSLATLRGGAAIGQALDNLLILERVRGQDNISRLSLEVARHKLCKLGDIFLKYDPETTRFEEVEKALVQPQGIDDPEQEYGGKFSRGSKPFKPYRLDG
jgi:replicative DNA helicase